MGHISPEQALEMIRRTECARGHKPELAPADAAERETGRGGLHEQIARHCAAQWPKWLLVHSRSDKCSTLPVGCNDDFVFLPGGKLLLLEEKARDGKLSPEQQIWIKQMAMLGHSVHVIKSLHEFVDLTL